MTTLAPIQPPVIKTRAQFEIVVENIVEMKRSRADAVNMMEMEIAAVREKHQKLILEIEHHLRAETEWAQMWFLQHPEVMDKDRALKLNVATVGLVSSGRELVRASRRWTWTRIAEALGQLPWGKNYLRQPEPEVDKDKVLANLAVLDPVELRAAGLKVIEGEHFFIEPKPSTESINENAPRT
jgi:hypothetical protein